MRVPPGVDPVTATGDPGPGIFDWVLVGALTLLAGVIGVFGIFFLPLYNGSFPLPVVVLAVGLALAVIPRVGYRLTGRMVASILPVVLWFLVTFGLSLTNNSLYRGAALAWRGWQFGLLLGVGGLAAAASIGLLWGDHVRVEMAARSGAGSVRR
ncbi:hypothetical protein ABIB25_003782 [Nakamurella sp. UYEF19]|uniref:hypothetical protein n=1 Tax=Nakamurella sp. UYEF19 TaxID=1756392 RepID=UPI003399AFCA